jgi:hypothetical protein
MNILYLKECFFKLFNRDTCNWISLLLVCVSNRHAHAISVLAILKSFFFSIDPKQSLAFCIVSKRLSISIEPTQSNHSVPRNAVHKERVLLFLAILSNSLNDCATKDYIPRENLYFRKSKYICSIPKATFKLPMRFHNPARKR